MAAPKSLMVTTGRALRLLIILYLRSADWYIHDDCFKDAWGKPVSKEIITLIPIGAIDKEFLKMLANSLETVFNRSVSIYATLQLPSTAYNPKRKQYHATTILQMVMQNILPAEGKSLGIVTVDLYVPELNFVFGQAELSGKAAIISLTRLRQKFYNLPEDKDLFLTRVFKEAIHELGHTYGLRHCQNHRCVMYFSHSLADTDRKPPNFCPPCRKKLPQKIN